MRVPIRNPVVGIKLESEEMKQPSSAEVQNVINEYIAQLNPRLRKLNVTVRYAADDFSESY